MSLKIEYMECSEIRPYENNAKKHPDEQIKEIKESIRKFEMVDPIGIWSEDNIIVEGHGRLIACQELGIKTVPVIRLDHLTDDERKAYALVHNKTTLDSGIDQDMLKVEIEDIQGIDMTDFGFDIEQIPNAEAVEDDYEAELPEEPESKVGQIYKLGNHRIMCGDSTEIDDVKNLMGGGYGKHSSNRPTIQC